jgi:uncharacterized peroxidase-related enzyme
VRLGILEQGHRLRQRIALRVVRLVGRTEPDPVMKVSLYRPELFGRPWMHFVEGVMRGPSEWTEPERELLAAFVSRLNSCPFCVGIHEGTASLLLSSHTSVDLLRRWRDPDAFEPRLATTFALLEKVTITPEAVRPADVAPLRAAGLSDAAISDALYLCFVFNTINRLANALEFHWETETDRQRLAAGLNRIRYHAPEFLLR